jgi:tRNA A37 threonylcarbamoyltransferase TsaD
VKPLRFVTMTELPGLVLALLACASVAAAISALRDADKP